MITIARWWHHVYYWFFSIKYVIRKTIKHNLWSGKKKLQYDGWLLKTFLGIVALGSINSYIVGSIGALILLPHWLWAAYCLIMASIILIACFGQIILTQDRWLKVGRELSHNAINMLCYIYDPVNAHKITHRYKQYSYVMQQKGYQGTNSEISIGELSYYEPLFCSLGLLVDNTALMQDPLLRQRFEWVALTSDGFSFIQWYNGEI